MTSILLAAVGILFVVGIPVELSSSLFTAFFSPVTSIEAQGATALSAALRSLTLLRELDLLGTWCSLSGFPNTMIPIL